MLIINIYIKDLVKTSEACPSQWEGHFDDGSYLYVRYRWGALRVEKDGNVIFHEHIGDDFDGYMDTEDMLEYTGLEIIE